MDSIDSATWQALGLILTIVGLGASALVWTRRGPVSGLRGVAWSLIPLAAGLTGVLRLGWEITDAVASWAGRLVFSPVVWLGLVVAALSVVLFVVTGFMRGRGRGGAPADRVGGRVKSPAAVTATGRPAARVPADNSPSRRSSPSTDSGVDDTADMADIEEILRKHGIQ